MTYRSNRYYYTPLGLGNVPVGFDPWSLTISGAIMGVTMLIGHFKRRGAQKVAATQIVEEGSGLLQQNLDAWNSSPKTTQDQQTALENFDQIWSEIANACKNNELGSAGERCISERQRGSVAQCYINGTLGGCDFFAKFRDPIANDPNVRPLTTAEQVLPSQVSGFFVDAQGNPTFDTQMAMVAGGILLAALVVPRFL